MKKRLHGGIEEQSRRRKWRSSSTEQTVDTKPNAHLLKRQIEMEISQPVANKVKGHYSSHKLTMPVPLH